MTGFGEARRGRDGFAVRVEVRSVNARFLKVVIRSNPMLSAGLEGELESIVRRFVRRGTVQLNVYLDYEPNPDDYRINSRVLLGYLQQISQLAINYGLVPPAGVEALLALPGVVSEMSDPSVHWQELAPLVTEAAQEALTQLQTMRQTEGRAMVEDFRQNCIRILDLTTEVEKRAPLVVENYRQKLQERITQLLGESGPVLHAEDIIKEISFFAERSDISEELVRLKSHVRQFLSTLEDHAEETAGRRLEFLTQEMFREINTMGAKANDAEISQRVVEMKILVERIREMVQNVE